MSNIGTYIIRHVTGVFYIGSTSRFAHRKSQHLYLLRNGRHHSDLLQRAWNKVPDVTREFTPATTREEAYLLERALMVQNFGSIAMANGTHHVMGGQAALGTESRRKISEAKIGIKQSPDLIALRVANRAGYRHSEETIAKISESHKGKVVSEESREKMREAKLGTKASDETRAKLSSMRRGVKKSAEHVAKMRASIPSIKIEVDGVSYSSASVAVTVLGTTVHTVLSRARDSREKWKNWKIIESDK